jgi:hypothetical protein
MQLAWQGGEAAWKRQHPPIEAHGQLQHLCAGHSLWKPSLAIAGRPRSSKLVFELESTGFVLTSLAMQPCEEQDRERKTEAKKVICPSENLASENRRVRGKSPDM